MRREESVNNCAPFLFGGGKRRTRSRHFSSDLYRVSEYVTGGRDREFLTSSRVGPATVCARFDRDKHSVVLFSGRKWRKVRWTEIQQARRAYRTRTRERNDWQQLPRLTARPIPAPPVHPLGTERNRLPRACVMRVKCLFASTVAGREIYKYADDGGRPVVPFPCATTTTTNPDPRA